MKNKELTIDFEAVTKTTINVKIPRQKVQELLFGFVRNELSVKKNCVIPNSVDVRSWVEVPSGGDRSNEELHFDSNGASIDCVNVTVSWDESS